ncbi:hypothetical protein DLJ53_04145 [Acuticoccus sediminis]|uniref:Uncharacterized protein n=1 Tax=Acuticoccus sediminis TaxID=2184697 RepID=A0A8B2P3H1_9HYPH|nr:hypothetical protein [Acuticoccus sediminis]RAI03682.1 hypothetical protein DLJ53_04145 [Acuticoccus sediminis]
MPFVDFESGEIRRLAREGWPIENRTPQGRTTVRQRGYETYHAAATIRWGIRYLGFRSVQN